MFQTTKIQTFESNSQLSEYDEKAIPCCFRLQRYKFLKAIHNYSCRDKFFCRLFQTTKIQIFESNSQLAEYEATAIPRCFRLQRYKFSQSNSQQIVAWVLYVVMLGHCVSQCSYNTCAENSLRLIVKCNHLKHTCCQLVRTTNGFHSSEVVNVRFIVEVIDIHTIQIFFFILSLSLPVSFLTYHHD